MTHLDTTNTTIRNIPLNGKSMNPHMRELTFLDSGAVIFISYRTPVAAKVPTGRFGEWEYLRTQRNHSVTTSKHLNKWFSRNTCKADVVKLVPQAVLDSFIPSNVSV